jgi:hypothetical protein
MKPGLFLLLPVIGMWVLTPVSASAANLSPDNLNKFDEHGYFTPAFKAAVHDMVDARQAVEQAKIDERQLKKNLPDLQQQADAAEAKAKALREEFAKYDNTDQSDFEALQASLKDDKAKPEDQSILAQAYVWAYPASPHQSEAQQIFQDLQKKVADQKQAEKAAEAKRVADRADILNRVQTRQLSLVEWKTFLQDMSQQDVLKYMGHPQSAGVDFWVYRGGWTDDAATKQRVGLMIGFNGTRVNVVTEAPPP